MLFYFLFYTDGDLRTFTLLFYVVLFLVLYWWWSQDIYFTVLHCFISRSHRIKSHKTSSKKSHRKKVTIYFFHIYYTPESHSMYNEWLSPYPGYGVYRHFQFFSVILWLTSYQFAKFKDQINIGPGY
jgi:hypothetical protein